MKTCPYCSRQLSGDICPAHGFIGVRKPEPGISRATTQALIQAAVDAVSAGSSAKWYSGAGEPSEASYNVGDWYLNTSNGDVYEKTGSSAWTLRDNLTGPTGAAGEKGDPGEGTAPERTTATYTTASIAYMAVETGDVTLSKAYRILAVETDIPARVRLYTTTAKRTADASRGAGVDPVGDHGCMLDFVTTTDVLSADLSPLVDGFSATSAIPISVQNLSGSTDTVSVTFTYIPTEA